MLKICKSAPSARDFSKSIIAQSPHKFNIYFFAKIVLTDRKNGSGLRRLRRRANEGLLPCRMQKPPKKGALVHPAGILRRKRLVRRLRRRTNPRVLAPPSQKSPRKGGFGVSVGARTRTEGVGGLYGIQFHHGHMDYAAIIPHSARKCFIFLREYAIILKNFWGGDRCGTIRIQRRSSSA